jgi:hypothetical protein
LYVQQAIEEGGDVAELWAEYYSDYDGIHLPGEEEEEDEYYVDLMVGDYEVTLARGGDNAITFDRYYKGDVDSKQTHVFDDRAHDDFNTHSNDPYWVAVMIHWSCTGRAANSAELAAIREAIKPLYN